MRLFAGVLDDLTAKAEILVQHSCIERVRSYQSARSAATDASKVYFRWLQLSLDNDHYTFAITRVTRGRGYRFTFVLARTWRFFDCGSHR
jgi:hypothetical protein